MFGLIAWVAAIILVAVTKPGTTPDAFDGWKDTDTPAIFWGVRPTPEHEELWRVVYGTAEDVWSNAPGPVNVWFIYDANQPIYLSGRTTTLSLEYAGYAAWGNPFRDPDLYVRATVLPYYLVYALCHEFTHVTWGYGDHGAMFWAYCDELYEAVLARRDAKADADSRQRGVWAQAWKDMVDAGDARPQTAPGTEHRNPRAPAYGRRNAPGGARSESAGERAENRRSERDHQKRPRTANSPANIAALNRL